MDTLSKLRHNFLILGFTGPLRSGCTTAAKFFSDGKISEKIAALIASEDTLQSGIEGAYREVHEIKTSKLTNKGTYDNGIHDEINKKSDDLKSMLKRRETLKALRYSASDPQHFQYISLTEMIFKIIVENREEHEKAHGLNSMSADDLKKTDFIKNLLTNIDDAFPEAFLVKINETSDRIRKRTLDELQQTDFDEYDNYLVDISRFCKTIKEMPFDKQFIGEMLQDFGDNLRRSGNAFDYRPEEIHRDKLFILAEEANNLVKYFSAKQKRESSTKPRQLVIEAFRNPHEVEYFRDRYYEFFLISLYADIEIRKTRDPFSKERDRRDRGEGINMESLHQQNVSEYVRLSDIAINSEAREADLYDKLLDYFALIKQPGCFAPEWEETAMHMAYSMSVRSTCISRQVGAVIEGANGYIVGAGWNDVGKGQLGCGYRCYRDLINLDSTILPCYRENEEAFRDKWLIEKASKTSETNAFCYKDEYSKFEMNKRIDKAVQTSKWWEDSEAMINVKEDIKKEVSKTKRLEYCRALHAEENAILQTAVIGGIGVRGSIMYTTTFPCELCAKKIYQSGIRKVVYTEPYPRSLSQDVFFRDGLRNIELAQFEGVKSHSYYRLYKATVNKKEIIELNQ
jgi:deoxycytidylate deaminase